MDISVPAISIVGCGPGSLEYLTASARDAIKDAEVLVGADRLLKLFPDIQAKRINVGADIEAALDEMSSYFGRLRIVVLVTGDPGLCSLAQPIIKRFGRNACRVIPGISSVQVAFARIGVDWLDARIIDAHKGVPGTDPHILANEGKIAVLPGHTASKKWIADLIRAIGSTHRVYICQDLTLASEKISVIEVGESELGDFPARTILLFIKEGEL